MSFAELLYLKLSIHLKNSFSRFCYDNNLDFSVCGKVFGFARQTGEYVNWLCYLFFPDLIYWYLGCARQT